MEAPAATVGLRDSHPQHRGCEKTPPPHPGPLAPRGSSPRRQDGPARERRRTHANEGAVEVEALPAPPSHLHPAPGTRVPERGEDEEEDVGAHVGAQEEELAPVVVPVRRGEVARPAARFLVRGGLEPVGSAVGEERSGAGDAAGGWHRPCSTRLHDTADPAGPQPHRAKEVLAFPCKPVAGGRSEHAASWHCS